MQQALKDSLPDGNEPDGKPHETLRFDFDLLVENDEGRCRVYDIDNNFLLGRVAELDPNGAARSDVRASELDDRLSEVDSAVSSGATCREAAVVTGGFVLFCFFFSRS